MNCFSSIGTTLDAVLARSRKPSPPGTEPQHFTPESAHADFDRTAMAARQGSRSEIEYWQGHALKSISWLNAISRSKPRARMAFWLSAGMLVSAFEIALWAASLDLTSETGTASLLATGASLSILALLTRIIHSNIPADYTTHAGFSEHQRRAILSILTAGFASCSDPFLALGPDHAAAPSMLAMQLASRLQTDAHFPILLAALVLCAFYALSSHKLHHSACELESGTTRHLSAVQQAALSRAYAAFHACSKALDERRGDLDLMEAAVSEQSLLDSALPTEARLAVRNPSRL